MHTARGLPRCEGICYRFVDSRAKGVQLEVVKCYAQQVSDGVGSLSSLGKVMWVLEVHDQGMIEQLNLETGMLQIDV